MGREIARAFERATTSKDSQRPRALSGLRTLSSRQFIDAMGIEGVTKATRLTLLYLDIARIKDIYTNRTDDRLEMTRCDVVTTQAIAIVAAIRHPVQDGNSFRCVTATTRQTHRRLLKATQQAFQANPLRLKSGAAVDVTFGVNRRRP